MSEDTQTMPSYLAAAGLGRAIVSVSVLAAHKHLKVVAEDLTIDGQPLARQVLAMTRRGYIDPLSDEICRELRLALATLSPPTRQSPPRPCRRRDRRLHEPSAINGPLRTVSAGHLRSATSAHR
jgi:hypothetical protein